MLAQWLVRLRSAGVVWRWRLASVGSASRFPRTAGRYWDRQWPIKYAIIIQSGSSIVEIDSGRHLDVFARVHGGGYRPSGNTQTAATKTPLAKKQNRTEPHLETSNTIALLTFLDAMLQTQQLYWTTIMKDCRCGTVWILLSNANRSHGCIMCNGN